MSKNIYKGICSKCQNPFEKEIKWGYSAKRRPRFCSLSCANSRGSMSKKDKELRRLYAKDNPKGWADPSLNIGYQKGDKIVKRIIRTCKLSTCNNTFETTLSRNKIYCSNSCFKQEAGGYRKESFRYGVKGYYQGIHCDSTWELAFLIYHLDHNSNITREVETLSYINVNGKERRYFPDFKIDEIVYEIKGILTENDKMKLKYNPQVQLIQKEDLNHIFKYIKAIYNKAPDKIKELYDSIDLTGK